ncbi:hypothetical protein [Actinocorallia herbida]|uniref:hypothetical protein n=1 Tax=Actinocorallia herbida TaxID=58109 RepID=UPI000F4C3FFC|nr:hypothetical protein [Actinocorallia herbida]
MTTASITARSADGLRAEMTAQLQERRCISRPEVAAAFATVPTERFCPEADVTAVYSYLDVVRTKFGEDGRRTTWRTSRHPAPVQDRHPLHHVRPRR